MTTFQKREDAFEAMFAHDQELRFKATARRNKLLGHWAAAQLGKSGPEAEAYAKEVVMADFEEVGEEDVFRKVQADLAAGGSKATEQEIRAAMAELMAKAVTEVKAS
ncbi:DUF1476 domain-containing protein [uncultured Alsobacter sp.]|uniref:DUF1476 domain-containing protein n=1 Tax=uncultured Alsobacter sp. TaxID=1748258 RepID=UPI0025F4CB87|nr:DUF1476 domain-containing protein [uncultured Alsobacter sp.]